MLTGEDFFKDKSDDFSSGVSSSSFGALQTDRVPMIEKIFQEVLGRKPSSREMAYYKYGVMKEDGIRSKLIKSDEHRELIEKAQKLPSVESELKDRRISERKLQQKVEDINSEMIESQKLLDEKNVLIKELREKVSNPYDFPTKIEKYEEGFDVFRPAPKIIPKVKGKRSMKEVLMDIIDVLFK